MKKIAAIVHLAPREVFQKIAEAGIEPPIPDRMAEYWQSVRKRMFSVEWGRGTMSSLRIRKNTIK